MATQAKIGATLHNDLAHRALGCCNEAVAGIRRVLKGDGSMLANAVLLGIVLTDLCQAQTALFEIIKIGKAAKAARTAT